MKRALRIYVVGTNTNVGKTVFTCLAVRELRRMGISAVALKPFCSGGREDAVLLQAEAPELTLDEVNPFCFRAPLAPMQAARIEGIEVTLRAVLEWADSFGGGEGICLMEGAGGLLSPLGTGFSLADVIKRRPGAVVLIADDSLGVINQVRLTVEALSTRGVKQICVVLMARKHPDMAARFNRRVLLEVLDDVAVVGIPWLGAKPFGEGAEKKFSKIFKKTLATWMVGN
jgi:dethiobiotin synthetase